MSDTTAWTFAVTGQAPNPAATLSVSINGAAATTVTLKGACYSPCEINNSNGSAPAVGDWFWDTYSGTGYTITGWEALWQRDLPNLRTLGVNTIRVYSMLSRQLNQDGTYPSPWNSTQLYTHTDFLDMCWNGGVNPIYVLVGIPLPQEMFWLQNYQSTSQTEKDFWENVLPETVAQVGSHPAVLGFIIQNELDSGVVTYGANTSYVDFWWAQVEHFAKAATTALNGSQKLVGMAVHDDPNICGQVGATKMQQVPSLQFWGVNSYQTLNFDSVFGPIPNIGNGYNGLSGSALKPVMLTEWGMPATSRTNPADPSTIYADSTTIQNTANSITTVVPTAYSQPLCLGLYYFEFCDEWWNQGGSPNIYTWWGGSAASGFPNGYWDQDGFGLYSIARGSSNGQQLPNDAPTWVNWGAYQGPNPAIDVHTPRTAAITALTAAFAAA